MGVGGGGEQALDTNGDKTRGWATSGGFVKFSPDGGDPQSPIGKTLAGKLISKLLDEF